MPQKKPPPRPRKKGPTPYKSIKARWDETGSRLCGIRYANGKLCRAPVVKEGMCEVHIKKTNNHRHFYANTLTEQERMEWDHITVGEVDNELRLARMQLRRVLEVQKKNKDKLLKIREVDKASDEGSENTITTELPDYISMINKFMTQIARLEKVKAEITHMVTAVHDDGVHGFRDRLKEMEDMDGDVDEDLDLEEGCAIE